MILIAVAVLVSVSGVVAARFIRSPAQVAADTREPAPSELTAQVDSRRLAVTEVIRGTVYPGVQYKITPTASSSAITGLYVSDLGVRAGETVQSGELLAAVSGRPLFVMHGTVPAYRNLTAGDSGDDVRQFQQALAELGYRRGADKRGTFGTGTAKAVTTFYRDRGYEPLPGASPPAASTAATTTPGAGSTQTPVSAAQIEVPSNELVFLPSLPATVAEVTAAVGRPVEGPLIVLTTGALLATGKLAPEKRQAIRKGMKASITDDTTGKTTAGTVISVGSPTTAELGGTVVPIGGAPAGETEQKAGTGSTADNSAYVPVTVGGTIPAALSGEDVRITIETASSKGKVLVVPISAVKTSADGSAQVVRVDGPGRTTVVPITTGMSAEGLVQVKASGRESLRPNDLVAVGRQ